MANTLMIVWLWRVLLLLFCCCCSSSSSSSSMKIMMVIVASIDFRTVFTIMLVTMFYLKFIRQAYKQHSRPSLYGC